MCDRVKKLVAVNKFPENIKTFNGLGQMILIKEISYTNISPRFKVFKEGQLNKILEKVKQKLSLDCDLKSTQNLRILTLF